MDTLLGGSTTFMQDLSDRNLSTDIASTNLKTNDEIREIPADNPQTLLALLQRAASHWPTHGILFKDRGWDHISDFMTYADLLQQAEVSRLN